MKELLAYLQEIGAEYEFAMENSLDDSIPDVMKEFYSHISHADFSFGRIFNVNEAVQMSKRTPFAPDWFVFGQDNYFSYWLCRREPDAEGKQFTYWDHGAGIDIDEPVWDTLLTFLQRIEEIASEYEKEVDEFDDEEWEE